MHAKEFSRRANSYDGYNIIQRKVARELLKKVDRPAKKILDLGCGSGAICKNIGVDFEKFIGVDISKEMCSFHPKAENIKILNYDFEDILLYDILKKDAPFDLILSSSALQWAKNLDFLAKKISELGSNIALSIFTDKTFYTIYRQTSLKSFLPGADDAAETFSKYFDIDAERKEYKLFFDDNISKFRYIKKSGVSGGKKRLGFKETKKLIKEYPLDYLEFEVLFIRTR